MKKNTFLIFLIIVSLAACKKDKNHLPSDQRDQQPLNVINLLQDDKDAENEKVNMILMHYANALKSIAKKPALLESIKELIKSDVKGMGGSLVKLASEKPDFKVALNEALSLSISENQVFPFYEDDYETTLNSDDWDANMYLYSKMLHHSKNYFPAVYSSKPIEEIAETNMSYRSGDVIIAIAEGVNDNNDVLAFNDDVPFLLSEQVASNSDDLIIFIGPGETLPANSNPLIISQGQGNISTSSGEFSWRADIDIDVDEHQIKAGYRYDDDNSSEVKAWSVRFFPNNLNPFFTSEWVDFSPKNISAADINASTLFTSDLNAFNINMNDFNNNQFLFVGAWEYDWYASNKIIINSCSNFVDHSVGVKMKFTDEWYFFSCGQANQWFPFVGATEVFDNAKCKFILKRKS